MQRSLPSLALTPRQRVSQGVRREVDGGGAHDAHAVVLRALRDLPQVNLPVCQVLVLQHWREQGSGGAGGGARSGCGAVGWRAGGKCCQRRATPTAAGATAAQAGKQAGAQAGEQGGGAAPCLLQREDDAHALGRQLVHVQRVAGLAAHNDVRGDVVEAAGRVLGARGGTRQGLVGELPRQGAWARRAARRYGRRRAARPVATSTAEQHPPICSLDGAIEVVLVRVVQVGPAHALRHVLRQGEGEAARKRAETGGRAGAGREPRGGKSAAIGVLRVRARRAGWGPSLAGRRPQGESRGAAAAGKGHKAPACWRQGRADVRHPRADHPCTASVRPQGHAGGGGRGREREDRQLVTRLPLPYPVLAPCCSATPTPRRSETDGVQAARRVPAPGALSCLWPRRQRAGAAEGSWRLAAAAGGRRRAASPRGPPRG